MSSAKQKAAAAAKRKKSISHLSKSTRTARKTRRQGGPTTQGASLMAAVLSVHPAHRLATSIPAIRSHRDAFLLYAIPVRNSYLPNLPIGQNLSVRFARLLGFHRVLTAV
jgi:hypothetical protein